MTGLSGRRAFATGAALVLLSWASLICQARGDVTSESSLDDTDQQERHDALDHLLAAPPGDAENWSNIDSGHRGAFKSLSERPSDGGQTCRDIAETVWFEDGQETGTLVACRGDATPWRIVSSTLAPVTQQPADSSATSQPPGLSNPPIQVWVGAPRGGGGATVVSPSSAGTP